VINKLIKKFKRMFWTYKVKNQTIHFGKNLKVNHKSFVTNKTYLGNNVNFNGMKISGCGMVFIGDNFHSGSECIIISENHNFDKGNAIPYDNTFICRDVIIEDNVWIGSRVILLGGIKIGEGAIIQAGSVVVSDIPKYSIAGGHPAKIFKTRDIEHYERLKEQKNFF